MAYMFCSGYGFRIGITLFIAFGFLIAGFMLRQPQAETTEVSPGALSWTSWILAILCLLASLYFAYDRWRCKSRTTAFARY